MRAARSELRPEPEKTELKIFRQMVAVAVVVLVLLLAVLVLLAVVVLALLVVVLVLSLLPVLLTVVGNTVKLFARTSTLQLHSYTLAVLWASRGSASFRPSPPPPPPPPAPAPPPPPAAAATCPPRVQLA